MGEIILDDLVWLSATTGVLIRDRQRETNTTEKVI